MMVYCFQNMSNIRKIKRMLAAGILFAVAGLALLISLRYRSPVAPSVAPATHPKADAALDKIHYSETRGGVKKWDLFAETLEYDNEKGVARLVQVKMIFPADRRTGRVTVTATRAEYSDKTRNVRLMGDVVAKTDSGMTFASASAFYDSARSLLTSDDRVRLRDGSMEMDGTGMEFPLETRNLRLLRDVTARALPAPNK